ncbi:MAG: RagB/SusD family nutrient uptake outer membrane protein [Chitinophagaceae bacterium]|nr:RagB/SusD family nutrient uptake outer membrane protein [Chitinophagaceae bacterium]
MKKLNHILFSALIASLLMPSCKKALELQPISQISNSSFWKTGDDAAGAMNGMYVNLRAEMLDGNLSCLFFLGDMRSDLLSTGMLTGPTAIYQNTLNPSNTTSDWSTYYTLIHSANLILKYVPNIDPITFSSYSKNDILAQAHAMRAYAYFVLVRTWGDLPLVTEPTESSANTQKPRSSKEEVFKLIKSDLDSSVALFPNNNLPVGRNIWSLPSVNALKADVYLWTGKRLNGGMADFNTALAALNQVQTADVQLLPDYADVFNYNNKGNKEILMTINFKQFESPGNNAFRLSYFPPELFSADFDDDSKAEIGTFGGSLGFQIADWIRPQFMVDDSRRNATFYELYKTDPITGDKSFFVSIQTKFRGAIVNGTRLFLNDYPIYRYSDVLLMKAEAKNALGQDPSIEMDMVRQRAYGSDFSSHVFVNGDMEQNDEAILKERLLEFALEGKRWWDLVRFGKVFEKVPSLQSRAGSDYLLLFPISANTLSLNPNLTQNPGYN